MTKSLRPLTVVLFGNGFRLTLPGERAEQFTEKCISTAAREQVALVRTSDLFRVSKKIVEFPSE